MFEAKPPIPYDARDTGEGGELRTLTWSDLRTRLDAARDLRSSLQSACDSATSFDALAATRIAGRPGSIQRVNPDDLGHGKGPSGTSSQPYESGSEEARGNR